MRGDGGFCREPILRWCEENTVDYVIGLPKNDRLKKEIENERLAARMFYHDNRQPARLFKCFEYQTRKSWSQKRTVVAKAEHLYEVFSNKKKTFCLVVVSVEVSTHFFTDTKHDSVRKQRIRGSW